MILEKKNLLKWDLDWTSVTWVINADANIQVVSIPLPSFVFALRKGTWGSSWGSSRSTGAVVACATAIVSTVLGTLTVASTVEAEAPLRGFLVLNSRHFAPKTIIILDTAILGFLAAIRGLVVR